MKKNKIKKFQIEASKRKELRYFSEAARKAILKEIENGMSKSEASRKYEVSLTAIYKWLKKYSNYQSGIRKVVEHQSDSEKNKLLKLELSQAFEMLGRLQAENMLLSQMIKLADEEFKVDIKKTFASKPSKLSKSKTKKSQR